MQVITITLDGVEVSGNPGMTILDLARESGVHIPTLCHDPHLNPYGACRVCVVENEQNGALLASCVAPIAPGMVINTRSEKVLESRRTIVKMMLASHPDNCMVCDKGNRCELRQIATDLGIGWVDLHRIPHPAETQDINPFIERDLSKCILCAKCIRADQELVVEGAIDYFNRGFASKPATLGDVPLELSSCTFCGTCVSLCPTGALQEKIKPYHGTTTKSVSTVCGFCGCGCNIDLEVSGDHIVRARPSEGDTVNGATVCVRGSYGFDFIHNPERLTQPLIRVDGELQPVSWEVAIDAVAKELGRIKSEHGPESLAVYGSSKCTNEDNFVLQKFAREVLGTPNIDNGGSHYNRTSRAVLADTLGFAAGTNPICDIEKAEVILLIGDDPQISAPQISYAIKRAVRFKKAKLITVNAWPTALDGFSHQLIIPQPGTEVAVVNGMMKYIIDQGIWNKDFVSERADSFDAFASSLEQYEPGLVAGSANVSASDIETAAREISQADKVVIVYGSAVTRRDDSDTVASLVNLALLTGNIGQEGAGIIAIQEENNGLGACDMGCVPEFGPGYESVKGEAGLSFTQMIERAKAGELKAIYVVGENPLGCGLYQSFIRESLSSLECLVVQDLFLSDTARLANVVLPASSFAEKDGTFTNLERRIQHVRQAIEPYAGSLPDWQIVQKLAAAMNQQMPYETASEITDEIALRVPLYQALNDQGPFGGGFFWPRISGQRFGDRRLYQEGFPQGRVHFILAKGEMPAAGVLDNYPYSILARRTQYRFSTGVRSTMSVRLNSMAEPVGAINT